MSSRSAAIETQRDTSAGRLMVPELEALLAERRLQEEQSQLLNPSHTNVVSASENGAPKAVGPTVYIHVKVGVVAVDAMVDTGS